MSLNINWQKFWQQHSWLNYLLLPLSWLFFALLKLRILLYKINILRTNKPDIPVIVIGNINVGGSGKTPFVIALGKLLAKNNIKYAVVSKGYNANYRKSIPYKIVEKTDLASFVGDEPLLIKLKLNCPVVVSRSRLTAIQIVKKHFPDIQLILTDDGLQDYKLQPSLKIAIVHANYKFGNNMLLPAGCLREPVSRLSAMDFVILNGKSNSYLNKYVNNEYFYQLRYEDWRQINNPINNPNNKLTNKDISNKTNLLAITGIAHPNYFFKYLTNSAIIANTKIYPDHYAYNGKELIADKSILMTEKDYVKLKEFSHDNAWYLEVNAVINPLLEQLLLEKIKNILKIN